MHSAALLVQQMQPGAAVRRGQGLGQAACGARQGCGKTTLVEQLEALFEHVGTRCAGVSVDDFYLTFADQQALAKARFAAARAG
jgi:pantothenate kinase-related protein Tda10